MCIYQPSPFNTSVDLAYICINKKISTWNFILCSAYPLEHVNWCVLLGWLIIILFTSYILICMKWSNSIAYQLEFELEM